MTQEVLAKNIERWRLFYPQQALALKELNKQNVVFHTNSDNSLNLKISDKDCYYHALLNPEDEAKQWFESLNLKGKNALIVLGVGLGYLYDAAKSWLHSNSLYTLIFLELDPEIIQHLFETERGTAILMDNQVCLAPIDLNGHMDIILPVFANNAYLFVSLPLYEKNLSGFIEVCKSNVALQLKMKRDTILEFVDHGFGFCSNYYRNLLLLPQAYSGQSLMGQFKDIPAIICGAGPSLEKSFPFLQESKDKALIFGGGTAMNALNVAGVLPHFGVGIDPNLAQFTRLIMNQAYEVPYFYRSRMSNKAVDFLHGARLFLTGSIGYDISAFFENKLGLKGDAILEGHNVINFSLSIALALGCNPIILLGVDLAYTDGLSYCKGILNHPLHERKDFFGTKTSQDDLIQKPDIYGKPVLTLWKWMAESIWFSTIAQQNPLIQFYNASQGGVGFQGISNVTEDFLSKQVLQHTYDFEGRIHALLMNAEMPKQVNKSSVIDALVELLESLKKCENFLESLYKTMSETAYRQELEPEDKTIQSSDFEIETRHKLEDEIGYKHLLKNLGEAYATIYQLEYRRLVTDESLISLKEFALKKIKLEKGKLIFQLEAAKKHKELLETILEENAQQEMGCKLTSPSEVPQIFNTHPKEVYSYENNALKLFDPLIELDIQESFVPDPDRGGESPKDMDSIKQKIFYKDGKLHGPSTYYSQDGMLLARHWYLHGILEGKGEGFYLNGKPAYITRYKHGKREGSQFYFFTDGSIKSILNYSQGLLHGDINLYYPTGQLFRKLYFENGKRKGFDKIWNSTGRLIIEAEFNLDLPIGSAKQWHPSGALAQEVVFTPDSPLYEVHHWNEQGAPIAHLNPRHDFFDNVAKQTQILTNTLQDALNEVESVLPIMDKPEAAGSMHGLSNDINALQKEITLLKKITDKLMFESGLDPSNLQEAIWKTPDLRQEIELEISKINDTLSSEMLALKKALHNQHKNIPKNSKSSEQHE